GTNIAAHLGRAWPRLSVDYVIASAPDVIVDGQMGSDASSPGGYWQKYKTIPAVRNHRLYGFAENPMLRPGPRVWLSLELLASYIHPEAKLPKADSLGHVDSTTVANAAQ